MTLDKYYAFQMVNSKFRYNWVNLQNKSVCNGKRCQIFVEKTGDL